MARPAQSTKGGLVPSFAELTALLQQPGPAWFALGLAMVVAAGVILALGEGTTLFNDELFVFSISNSNLEYLLTPHNSHLTAPVRLLYEGVFSAFGPEYAVFRVISVAGLLLSVGLFFELARRRIGPLPALAPSILLLFLGFAWETILWPFTGIETFYSIAAGLGALLALERDDRAGDVAAMLLLILSIAIFTIGLVFLVGVAVSVLIRPDRWRRVWIFLVPLVLYGSWWMWAQRFDQSPVRLGNVLLIPSYVADSLAGVLGALAGLNEIVAGESPAAAPTQEIEWGRLLAIFAVAALVLRLSRGRLPSSLWVSLAVLLTYWVAGALALGPFRAPEASRYVFPGAIGVLLVATDAARGMRFSRTAIAVLFGALLFTVPVNLHQLNDASTFLAAHSDNARAQLAMLELAADEVDPAYNPRQDSRVVQRVPPHFPVTAGLYLAAAERYGSPAFSLDELRAQSEVVSQGADAILAASLDLSLQPASGPEHLADCRRTGGGEGETSLELPPGGGLLRSEGPAEVMLARFADLPVAGVGSLAGGRFMALRIPADSAREPWRATLSTNGPLTICPL